MPSSLPSGPNFSLVVAFTPTQLVSSNIEEAKFLRIWSICGFNFGRSATITESTLTISQPFDFTIFFICLIEYLEYSIEYTSSRLPEI